jgi:hypothetical protein
MDASGDASTDGLWFTGNPTRALLSSRVSVPKPQRLSVPPLRPGANALPVQSGRRSSTGKPLIGSMGKSSSHVTTPVAVGAALLR